LISSLRRARCGGQCVTNDVRVPADAEWVLEGSSTRAVMSSRKGYGEFLGY